VYVLILQMMHDRGAHLRCNCT